MINTIKDLLKETYGTILLWVLPALAAFFKNNIIQIFPKIEFWFWIAVISAGLLLISLVYILYNRPKYEIDKESHCYIDKKGNKFCPSCMAKDRQRLIKESNFQWLCTNDECNFIENKDGSCPDSFSCGVSFRAKL